MEIWGFGSKMATAYNGPYTIRAHTRTRTEPSRDSLPSPLISTTTSQQATTRCTAVAWVHTGSRCVSTAPSHQPLLGEGETERARSHTPGEVLLSSQAVISQALQKPDSFSVDEQEMCLASYPARPLALGLSKEEDARMAMALEKEHTPVDFQGKRMSRARARRQEGARSRNADVSRALL